MCVLSDMHLRFILKPWMMDTLVYVASKLTGDLPEELILLPFAFKKFGCIRIFIIEHVPLHSKSL